MFSLKYVSIFPMRKVLQSSSLMQISGREISFWNAARHHDGFPNIACCSNCGFNNVHHKAFLPTFSRSAQVRSMSSREGKGSGDFPFVNPDVGDIIDQVPRLKHVSPKSKARVNVKFNWKNSLVTADTLNLMETLYQSHPQLIEFDEEALIDYLQRMSIFSIDVEKAAKMVIMNPRLLKMTNDQIGTIVSAFRDIGLSETQRGHICRSMPEIFNYPRKIIINQFTFLKTYLTKDETVDLVCKTVDVFLQSESTLKAKLEYLIKDMSHETKNIATCKVLSYSLRHIKIRHEFLIRSGLFKPIPYRKLIKVLEKEYKDKNKQRSKYFKPLEIVCYKDEDFLKVCTKNLITLNELVAFEELYGAELDVIKDDFDDEGDEVEEYDDSGDFKETVSIINSTNSVGFFNDVEAKSCYF